MGSSPVRVTKTDQSTEGGLICFAHSPRDSKGAGVNDVPVARQSRDPARPQARSPVRVTKTDQSTEGGLICFAHSPRDSKGAGVNDVPVARQSRDPARPQARSPVRVTTSEQSPLRSKSGSSFRVAGFFVYAPLLLLSKSNPLRWASIWFFVLSSKLADLFCIFSAGLETVPHRQHRRKRNALAAGFYHFSVSFSALSGAFFNSFIIFPSESRSTGFAIWAVMPASRHF